MADERRRTKKKVKRRIRPGCMVSVVILLLSWIILFLTPVFNVNRVIVEGNTTVKTETILAASGVRAGQNLFRSNLGRAKSEISKLNYIEDVSVKRVFPDKIKITVEEGSVAAYFKVDKSYVGINKQGKVLCSLNEADITKPAPRVRGISVLKSQVGQAIEVKETARFDVLLKFLKTFETEGMREEITDFDITDSDYIVFRHRDKLKVEFGDEKNFDHKFSFLKGLLNEMGQDVEGELNMISENYTYSHTVD